MIRAGVIGAGSWAVAAHLPVLAAREDVEVVGICRQGPLLDPIADKFGVAARSEDYHDVLDLDLDVCVVSSPSSFHHEHVAAALRSGAHVLCEKPMTIDPAQAWDLVKIAGENDRELLVSFGWNYMPIVRSAVELFAGEVGDIEFLDVHMESSTRELLSNTGSYPTSSPDAIPESSTWTDPSRSGGGYGQAQLSHALALALALAPDVDIVGADAVGASPLGAPVELHVAAVLRFGNGGVGTVSGASSHAGARRDKHQLDVRCVGSRGQFIVDVHRELVWLRKSNGTEVELELPVDAGAYSIKGPANALADVGGGNRAANVANGALGARTVDVLNLMYSSMAHRDT